MRKTIIGLVAAFALTTGAVQPVHATEQDAIAVLEDSTSPELSSGSSGDSPRDESKGEDDTDGIALVVGIIAVTGLIAGGVYWAVQERLIANPLPGIIPNPPAPPAPAPAAAPAPAPAPAAPAPAPAKAKAPAPAPVNTAPYYKNCAAVRAAGKAPLYWNQPGYARHLDRDNDGIACE